MDGLKCLLAEVEQESDVITESDPNGDALFSALQDLVSNRPKNLLQELKGLVSRFSRRLAAPEAVTPEKGFSKGSNATLSDSSKGTGKKKRNPENTESRALQTKGKGKGKGKSAGPTQVTVSAPHESEASSWVTVVFNGRVKKESQVASEKQPVVALPSSSSEAELMWSLFGS